MVSREMKLQNLKNKLKKYPYVTRAFFASLVGSHNTIKNQLVKWIKSGEVICLRKGFYTLNNEDRSAGLSNKLVANVIYHPSYLSLEYALSFYDMIPEAVFSVTSVTPKKTQAFSNPLGEFLYKSIKKELFFGYVSVKDEFGCEILIASPEKALLDFFYFKTPANIKVTGPYFEESLRLQNMEMIDEKKFVQFAKKFNSRKMDKIVGAFLKWKETAQVS